MNQSNQKYFALAGACIVWASVLLQLYLIIANRVEPIGETLIRFFSYFTILTNTLVAIYFSYRLLERKSFLSKPGVLTAIAVYITIVGLVYQVALRHIWEPTGLQMIVDELLHTFSPVFVIAFWALYESRPELNWRMIPAWLIYPLVYLIYVLTRGSFSRFYPYPFINVLELGFKMVLINSVMLLFVFILMSILFVWTGRLLNRRIANQ